MKQKINLTKSYVKYVSKPKQRVLNENDVLKMKYLGYALSAPKLLEFIKSFEK